MDTLRFDLSRYYVVYDGEWKIQCDGENSEPYRHRSEAFRDAVALAHLDVRGGREADVIVQCEDDMFRPEWDSPATPIRHRWCLNTETSRIARVRSRPFRQAECRWRDGAGVSAANV